MCEDRVNSSIRVLYTMFLFEFGLRLGEDDISCREESTNISIWLCSLLMEDIMVGV
jgi:hypothetical protein